MKIIPSLSLVISIAAFVMVYLDANQNRNQSELVILRNELIQAQQNLKTSDLKLSAISTRLTDLERNASNFLGTANKTIVHSVSRAQNLISATDSNSLSPGIVVYENNEKLPIGIGSTVSSPNNVMVSDGGSGLIVGDLVIDTPHIIIKADEAVVDVHTEAINATQIELSPKSGEFKTQFLPIDSGSAEPKNLKKR